MLAKLVSLYCAIVQLFVNCSDKKIFRMFVKKSSSFIALILVIYMMSFAITNTGNYGKHNYFSKAIPSNVLSSTYFLGKTFFFSKIFLGDPPLNFLEVYLKFRSMER